MKMTLILPRPILFFLTILSLWAAAVIAEGQTSKENRKNSFLNVRYRVTDVGPLPYVSDDVAAAINDAGQVSYWTRTSDGTIHAALWTAGRTQDLGTLKSNASSISHALNDKGQAVGWSVSGKNLVDSLSTTHAVLYGQREILDLGTLGGRDSQAMGMNDSGAIVGVSSLPDKTRHAFLYRNGRMQDLGVLPGGAFSSASAVNNDGDIAGTAETTGQFIHAVLWKEGKLVDLGTLPGGKRSRALALNNKGGVVGFSEVEHGEVHAFLYARGKMQDLGTLKQDPIRANSINDHGEIVGHSGISASAIHPFLWQAGTMADLNNLIPATPKWTLKDAYAINNSGEILCAGSTADGSGELHLLLLKQVRQ